MSQGRSVLCVANYPSNTGYAWDFIESLYARIADNLAPDGVATYVAYPQIAEAPRTLAGSAATAVLLDARLRDWQSIARTMRFVRQQRVRVVYLTDRPAWSFRYLPIRLAGVRRIVVHRHNAGGETPSRGIRRLVKGLLARAPGAAADVIIAVSEYVARMQVATTAIPSRRVQRVWNGIRIDQDVRSELDVGKQFGLADCQVIFACACRAAPLKGVPVLMRAFDQMVRRWPTNRRRPGLLYIGDGPQFQELAGLRESLGSRDQIALTGFRRDVDRILRGVDVCVVASTEPDALPLSVLQPMTLGKPVIGSRIGGIPEMIVDGETGLLVPPGDVDALADAMLRLGTDPDFARRLGARGRERALEHFSPDGQISRLCAIVREGLDADGPARPPSR